MAKSSTDEEVQAVEYISLHQFAHGNVPKPYSVELMAGFYHTQETANPPHLADTVDNWHALIKVYAEAEVK